MDTIEEEEFFRGTQKNTSNQSNNSQHVRVIIQRGPSNPATGVLFRSFMDSVYFQQPVKKHEGSFWHFSKKEINDLILATLAFGLALSFMELDGIFGLLSSTESSGAAIFWLVSFGIIYILALGPAFIIHELAHKFLARHYGCWAEFRADPQGLKVGVLIAALVGVVFMAPGAVMVAGNITKSQNGKIALAGPISNLILFALGLIGGGLLLGLFSTWYVELFVFAWLWGNAVLAAFNMIPFGPLDGRKVKDWSEPIFWIFMLFTLSLAFATLFGYFIPILELISGTTLRN